MHSRKIATYKLCMFTVLFKIYFHSKYLQKKKKINILFKKFNQDFLFYKKIHLNFMKINSKRIGKFQFMKT